MKKQIGSALSILKVYKQSTIGERREGIWYWLQTRDRLEQVAMKNGISLRKVTGVFAALSPNNDEDGNYLDLKAMVDWYLAGGRDDLPKIRSYPLNREKAKKILLGRDPIDILKGNKVRSYYLNCFGPVDPEPVCIDGHMVSVWLGRRILLRSKEATITTTRYNMVAEDIRFAAKSEGILPNQMQAICWLTWKRINNIKWNPQMRLWMPEEG
jgi:hypothetical protein